MEYKDYSDPFDTVDKTQEFTIGFCGLHDKTRTDLCNVDAYTIRAFLDEKYTHYLDTTLFWIMSELKIGETEYCSLNLYSPNSKWVLDTIMCRVTRTK